MCRCGLVVVQRGPDFTEILARLPDLTEVDFCLQGSSDVKVEDVYDKNLKVSWANEWTLGCPALWRIMFLDGTSLVRDGDT